MKNESQRVLGRILAQTLPEADVSMMVGAGAALPNPGTVKTILTGDVIIAQHSDGFSFDGSWGGSRE